MFYEHILHGFQATKWNLLFRMFKAVQLPNYADQGYISCNHHIVSLRFIFVKVRQYIIFDLK